MKAEISNETKRKAIVMGKSEIIHHSIYTPKMAVYVSWPVVGVHYKKPETSWI